MNCMFVNHLVSISYMAVLVSAVASFVLGSLWFSGLFGRIWVQELARHNWVIQQPTSNAMMQKMVLTFLGNLITSAAIAVLVDITGSATLCSALQLGGLIAIGFVTTAMGVSFVWCGRSLKLSLIDIGYPAAAVVLSTIILSLWQ